MIIDNGKETVCSKLNRTIWNIDNDLRGSVDGQNYKQFVLDVLFYSHISKNLEVQRIMEHKQEPRNEIDDIIKELGDVH